MHRPYSKSSVRRPSKQRNKHHTTRSFVLTTAAPRRSRPSTSSGVFATWPHGKVNQNANSKVNKSAIILASLIAINVAVFLYHGDPIAAATEQNASRSGGITHLSLLPLLDSELPELALKTSPAKTKAADSPSTSTGQALARIKQNPQNEQNEQSPHQLKIVLRRGQTAAHALKKVGVARGVIAQVLLSLEPLVDFRFLRPGNTFELTFGSPYQQRLGGLTELKLVQGVLQQYIAKLNDGGRWQAHKIEIPVETVITRISGTVKSSLWAALVSNKKSKEDGRLVQLVVDLFAWDIDFFTEVFTGDTFRVLVEKRYAQGQFLDYGDILAAEFVTAGIPHQGFISRSNSGITSYFDSKGDSLRKQLLKAPLKYANITSTFGRRRHPVLGYTRAHNGIDYGVPTGTPIWSVGDGKVVYAGRKGGYGNYVEVRHANGWLSEYAHMSKIKVKVGQRVEQKQVVGLVGNTGVSTGPHLHYGLKHHKKFVNPLKQKFKRGKALTGSRLKQFLSEVETLTLQLKSLS